MTFSVDPPVEILNEDGTLVDEDEWESLADEESTGRYDDLADIVPSW